MNLYSAIVIGAGPGGIAATKFLLDAGVDDILLVERESRPGG